MELANLPAPLCLGVNWLSKEELKNLMQNPKTKFWRNILMCYRMLYSLLDSSLQKNGTSLPRLQVLLVLFFEGPMVQITLSRRLMVTRGNVSSLLKRMLEEGLIEFSKTGGSKSRPAYTLSKVGLSLLEDLLPQHLANIDILIPDDSIAPESIQHLEKIQTHLTKTFDIGVTIASTNY